MGPTTTRSANRGADTLEYVMLAAIFCLGICIAAFACRDQIAGVFNGIRNNLETVSAGGNVNGGGGSATPGEPSAPAASGLPEEDADPSTWDLDQQKAVATDLERFGTASKYYEKAKSAMDAGTTWSVELTNDKELKYHIIGILHDDLADGGGKAGLTFFTSSDCFGKSSSCDGPWEKSEMREQLNAGSYWGLLPDSLKNKIAVVSKLTNNQSGIVNDATITSTQDRLFLLSQVERFGGDKTYAWEEKEGSPYERTPNPGYTRSLSIVKGYHLKLAQSNGQPIFYAMGGFKVLPAFCF